MYNGPTEPKSTTFWPSCEWSPMDKFDVYCQEVFLAYTRNIGLTSWSCLMNKRVAAHSVRSSTDLEICTI